MVMVPFTAHISQITKLKPQITNKYQITMSACPPVCLAGMSKSVYFWNLFVIWNL
jgi:hypothetical protein